MASLEGVQTVAIIGAGQMGRGIAAVVALAGYDVHVHDPDEGQLESVPDHAAWSYGKLEENDEISASERSNALARLQLAEGTESAVEGAKFVIEAGPEREAVKVEIFESLDEHAPDGAILASNTSGLSIGRLADATSRPEQVVGTHWFKPPVLMDLVELVATDKTAEEIIQRTEALVESFGKTTILCRRDVPWFIVNRCMRPFTDAPAWFVHRGETTIEAVDAAMKHGEGFPMGPFELTDYTGGIQLRVESEDDLVSDDRPLAFEAPFCPLFHELYEEGRFGRKSGAGFYDYSDQDSPEILPSAAEDFDPMLVWGPVINAAAKVVQADVATVEAVDTGLRLAGNWPKGPFEKAEEVGAARVVDACVEVAARHERMVNVAESLPCDLLLEEAKAGATFY
jgi:enoyl-CoA hydratase/3-hydroxyacyl-CoA dehydrogenase